MRTISVKASRALCELCSTAMPLPQRKIEKCHFCCRGLSKTVHELPASGSGANLVENHSKITIASQPDDSFILISRNLQNLRDARFPVSSISPLGHLSKGPRLPFPKSSNTTCTELRLVLTRQATTSLCKRRLPRKRTEGPLIAPKYQEN
jgi:hypothetical protein